MRVQDDVKARPRELSVVTRIIVDAAKACKNILQNKKSEAATWRDKQRAWKQFLVYIIHKQPQMRSSTLKTVSFSI